MKTQTAIDTFLYSRAAKSDTPATIAWYKIILDYYLTAYPEELPESPEAIERFLLSCKGGDQRRHGFYRTLKCLYRFLYRRKLILSNPIELIDAPRTRRTLPRALSTAELYNLLSYPHNARILAFLTFLADTGARIGELHQLQLADIIKTDYGWIARLNGKTGERYVPLLPETRDRIIEHIPITYCLDYMSDLIVKAFRAAGVRGSAHTLRHTYATLWGGSEFALQAILGHSSFEMLANYRRLRTRQLSEIHAQQSPLRLLPLFKAI